VQAELARERARPTFDFNASFFAENTERIFADDFAPTKDDVLQARSLTTGVHFIDVSRTPTRKETT